MKGEKRTDWTNRAYTFVDPYAAKEWVEKIKKDQQRGARGCERGEEDGLDE